MTDKSKKDPNAVALGRKGGKKGGPARAKKMTSAERSASAKKAAKARWSIPKAEYNGTLKIGELELPCSVLDEGTRVLSQRGFYRSIAEGQPGRATAVRDSDSKLPAFLTAKSLQPFISEELATTLKSPIRYRYIGGHGGGNVAHGIDARLIPKICRVWLDARRAGKLHYRQLPIAAKAELLLQGLAEVGIIALVDEATGYQYGRDRNALHKILEAYISEELLPWTKRFPDEFYAHLFRLRGWNYDPSSMKRPQYVGKLTNHLVYDQLPEGVLEELKKKNPRTKGGRPRHALHQYLTENVGHPHLEKQITSVVTLMRVSDDWDLEFAKLFQKAFPDAIPLHPIPERKRKSVPCVAPPQRRTFLGQRLLFPDDEYDEN